MTERQKQFVDFYIETGNQTEAARLAGYKQPHVQGAQNLDKLRVFIDEKLASKEDARIASQDEVLRFLTSIMRNEVTEQVVVTEAQGDYKTLARTISKGISAKDRIKAGELLGKRHGIFDPALAPKPAVEDDPLSASLKALAADMESIGEQDGGEHAD